MSSPSIHSGDQRRFAMGIDHRRARSRRGLCLLLGLLVLGECEAGQLPAPGSPAVVAADAISASMRPEESRMWMTVGERRFAITLADNETARALAALLPLLSNKK